MFKRLRESDFAPKITAPVSVPTFTVEDDKKMDVLISLQGTFRTSIANCKIEPAEEYMKCRR